jgi:hypothetical protein
MDVAGVGNQRIAVDTDTFGGRGGGGAIVAAMEVQTNRIEQALNALDGGRVGGGGSGGARNFRRGMRTMSESGGILDRFDLRMTDMHNALAKLVPLILVLIGALPALIGNLVALASAALAAAVALGSIAAFGALGASIARGGGVEGLGEGFEEIMSEIQDDFLDAFRPIAERLAPLFERGLDGLDRMFQLIANEGDALMQLRDDAIAFGSFMMNAMPSFLAEMALFVDATGDAMGLVVSFLSQLDVFGFLAHVIESTIGPMMMLMTALQGLMPVIIDVSAGFLAVVGGLFALIDLFAQLASILPIDARLFGALAAAMLTAVTAIAIFNSAVMQAAFTSLAALGTKVLAMISTFTSYSASAIIAAVSTYGLAGAVLTLIGVLTLGIGAVVTLGALTAALGDGFLNMSSDIDSATDSLKAFQRQQNRLDTNADNPYADPRVGRGEGTGRSRFSGSSVNVTVEGDADSETVEKQTKNAMYRLERPSR